MREATRQQLAAASALAQEGRLRDGIQATLAVLNEDPHEPEAVQQLDLFLNMALRQSAPEPFDPGLLREPRVLARMKICAQCQRMWAPRGMASVLGLIAAQVVIANPIGGKCPRCQRVFCRECATKDVLGTLHCPHCQRGFLRWRRRWVELDCVQY